MFEQIWSPVTFFGCWAIQMLLIFIDCEKLDMNIVLLVVFRQNSFECTWQF